MPTLLPRLEGDGPLGVFDFVAGFSVCRRLSRRGIANLIVASNGRNYSRVLSNFEIPLAATLTRHVGRLPEHEKLGFQDFRAQVGLD
jgi:hypothetical protein